MAEKIKNFFKRKKSDAKFKLAGPGHKLTESTSSFTTPKPSNKPAQKPRTDLSEEARAAASAALARIDSKQRKDQNFNTSFAAIQAQVKRELEAERKAANENEGVPSPSTKVTADPEPNYGVLAVSGVYFKCPMVGSQILSKEEWRIKIKEFLYEQLEFERGLTAVLIIYSINKNRDKVNQCVETLCKYLENIINNPTEEKYHKIKMSNRVFSEKVAPIEGTSELLDAAGFRQKKLTVDDHEEDFLVFDLGNIDNIDVLNILCDALRNAEPIPLELDRNIQVLSPSQASKRSELPLSFYAMTPEEIKKEQQYRTELMEKSMQLRTKAMREREEHREMKKYKFALIRVRFPDGIFLQGTFGVYEKLSQVFEFVKENLEYVDMPYHLTNPTGQRLNDSDDDMEKTLIDLHLVPAAILTFQWDSKVLSELTKSGDITYLKPEVQLLVQSI